MVDADGAPRPRRLRVDLAALVDALETASWDNSAYLDLETGQVIWITSEVAEELKRLEQEIVRDARADDRAFADARPGREIPAWLQEAVEEAGGIEGDLGTRYIRVEPASSRADYRDMEAFVEGVRSENLRERLRRAIAGRGAFRYFRDVLADYPRERERWFAFQAAQARQRALDWLADEGIEPILD